MWHTGLGSLCEETWPAPGEQGELWWYRSGSLIIARLCLFNLDPILNPGAPVVADSKVRSGPVLPLPLS